MSKLENSCGEVNIGWIILKHDIQVPKKLFSIGGTTFFIILEPLTDQFLQEFVLVLKRKKRKKMFKIAGILPLKVLLHLLFPR